MEIYFHRLLIFVVDLDTPNGILLLPLCVTSILPVLMWVYIRWDRA